MAAVDVGFGTAREVAARALPDEHYGCEAIARFDARSL
jgi:hypothetical protein